MSVSPSFSVSSAASRWPFAIALVLLAINTAFLVFNITKLKDATASVKHSMTAQRQMGEVLTALINAETGERGYLLTSDTRYLAPYHQASSEIDATLSQLRTTVSDSPGLLKRLDAVDELADRRLKELESIITTHESGLQDSAVEMVREDRGRQIMDEIRAEIGAMVDEETRLLRQREGEYLVLQVITYGSAAMFVVGTLVLLSIIFVYVRRQLRERTESEAKIADYAATLDRGLTQLQRERNEIAAINEASSLLQSCNNIDEYARTARPLLLSLFPEHAGEISLFAASRNQLTQLVSWGGWQEGTTLTPDECWALRRGQSHSHVRGDGTPACMHLDGHDDEASLCIPLVAQGDTLGLFVIANQPGRIDGPISADLRRTAELTARQLSLTLANLRLRETLKEQSVRDPLTNAFNRRYLENVGTKEIAQSARTGHVLAAIMLDVDHFKRFNDLHGHQAGDAALVAVASYLQDNIREGDWFFRYGGEEFVLLLRDGQPSDMMCKADELRMGVAALVLEHDGKTLPRVTASMGLAISAGREETLEMLLARADEALYAAKSAGRNRVLQAGDQSVLDAA